MHHFGRQALLVKMLITLEPLYAFGSNFEYSLLPFFLSFFFSFFFFLFFYSFFFFFFFWIFYVV